MTPAARRGALAALAALVLAGCGGEDGNEADVRAVRDVVERFAAAEDREACDLLTDEALVELYGGGETGTAGNAVDRAEDSCVRRSSQFRGARVRIEKVDVVAERAARVKAFNEPRRDREYNVVLRKPEGDDDWLIDQIIQKPVART